MDLLYRIIIVVLLLPYIIGESRNHYMGRQLLLYPIIVFGVITIHEATVTYSYSCLCQQLFYHNCKKADINSMQCFGAQPHIDVIIFGFLPIIIYTLSDFKNRVITPDAETTTLYIVKFRCYLNLVNNLAIAPPFANITI